jgi:hypothetical protein
MVVVVQGWWQSTMKLQPPTRCYLSCLWRCATPMALGILRRRSLLSCLLSCATPLERPQYIYTQALPKGCSSVGSVDKSLFICALRPLTGVYCRVSHRHHTQREPQRHVTQGELLPPETQGTSTREWVSDF